MAFQVRSLLSDGGPTPNAQGSTAPTLSQQIRAIDLKKQAGIPLTPQEISFYQKNWTLAGLDGNGDLSNPIWHEGQSDSSTNMENPVWHGGAAPNVNAYTGGAGASNNDSNANSYTGGAGASAGAPQQAVDSPFLKNLFGGISDSLLAAQQAAHNAPPPAPDYGQSGGYQTQSLPQFNLPDAPNISIAPKDFTQQASDMAKQAYQPTYDALDTGRANAKDQYNMADKIVAGLYEKLAGDTTARQADTKQQYGDAAAAQKANAAGTQEAIGQGYQAAQSDEAQLLKSLGIGSAAPGALQGANESRAFQQGQAATSSGAQAAALTQQGASQNDYQNNMASADATQGKVDREALVAGLGNTLSGYDQQQQNVAGQQGQQALTIGQGLTAQDLSTQQANAGFQEQHYSDQVSAAQAAYNAQVADVQFANQQQQQQYGQQQDAMKWQYQQQQDQAAAQAAAAKAQSDAQQQQWENNFNVNKWQTDAALGAGNLSVAQQNAASGAEAERWATSPNNPDNMPKASAVQAPGDIASKVASKLNGVMDPQQAIDMVNLVQGAYATNDSPTNASKQDFIRNAMNAAMAQGKDANAAATVAAAYADEVGLK